jgi:hypothetical protein
VVDPLHSAAGLPLRVTQEDPTAAADVEQSILWCECERGDHRLPRERVHVVGAVGLTGAPAVRSARDAVGQPVDPPFADATEEAQMAFWTFPAFRHRVQTYARCALPFKSTRTRWRFGSKRRFVATIEWLRWLPKPGFFPQDTQTLLIGPAW